MAATIITLHDEAERTHQAQRMAAMIAFILAAAKAGAAFDPSDNSGIEARFADCARQIGQRQATEIVGDYAHDIMRCFGPGMADMILNELETLLSRALRD